MEVNEVAGRLLRRYWLVLLLSVALPTIAMAAFVQKQHATYTAHARILASAETPRAQAEAAALVSQVQALATSQDLIATALSDVKVSRRADKVADDVTVSGLGSSAVVDLAYTDRDPGTARRVTGALAKAVTKKLDDVRIGGLPEVLKSVDDQLADLAAKRAPIAAEAQANPKDPVAQNRLAGIDRLISDLSADRNRLSEDAAGVGHTSVLTAPLTPDQADPKGLPAKLAIAAIVGLALGLILAGVNETVRPAVSGAPRVGRLLDVPVLGAVKPDPTALADVGRRIRLAARRAGVSTVVLVRDNRAKLAPELVDRVEAAALRPDPVNGRLAIPIDSRELLDGPGETTRPIVLPTQADGRLAVLTKTENNSGKPSRLHRVCALDELDPNAETEKIGVVLLVGGSTRVASVDVVRDLLAASGWPLLGVLGDMR